ncbi:MAG: cell surface protein [Eubacteriales bacterium]|nr:cell surface protein [Eubacteriales bacterium]
MKRSKMFFVLLLITGSLIACNSQGTVKKEDVKIYPIEAKFAIDVYSYPEQAGAADYVCIGEVVEELETTNALSEEQIEELKKGLEDTSKVFFDPESHCMIRVIENLKGELDQSKPIRIDKTGGIHPDGIEGSMFEDDIIPKLGEQYVFFIWVQEDGTNSVSGPNSNIPLNSDDMGRASTMSDRVRTTDREVVLEKVREAVENQVVPSWKTEIFLSNDDVGK